MAHITGKKKEVNEENIYHFIIHHIYHSSFFYGQRKTAFDQKISGR